MPRAVPSRATARAMSSGCVALPWPICARPSASRRRASGSVSGWFHSGIHCSPRALSSDAPALA